MTARSGIDDPTGGGTVEPPDRSGARRPGPAVVALGGGHGLSTTLQAVRLYASSVTAIVSVADDGGSSGRLRAISGMLAPGDIRRCLIALGDADAVWSRAFAHRFAAGDLEGHALGNVIIAGLAEVTGDFATALRLASDLLGVAANATVLPATLVPVHLKADVAGTEVLGQVNVMQAPERISAVSIVPPDAPSALAVAAAVAAADQVILGPGSLFTSVLATCVAPDIRRALLGRSAGRVYVCNLRPQLPETAGFGPGDHLEALLDHDIPLDVMVVDRGYQPPAERDLVARAAAAGVRVVTAEVAKPDRTAHDVGALATTLGGLAGVAADGLAADGPAAD